MYYIRTWARGFCYAAEEQENDTCSKEVLRQVREILANNGFSDQEQFAEAHRLIESHRIVDAMGYNINVIEFSDEALPSIRHDLKQKTLSYQAIGIAKCINVELDLEYHKEWARYEKLDGNSWVAVKNFLQEALVHVSYKDLDTKTLDAMFGKVMVRGFLNACREYGDQIPTAAAISKQCALLLNRLCFHR